MKIVTIVGARPQFIKLAPLSKALRENHEEILLHTGQHYDLELSSLIFQQLGIPLPDYNLEIGSGTHSSQTGEMLKGIEDVLVKEEPDLVIVFGDTNSTLAGALAAVKLQIEIAHVEAGLRSYNRKMPEEINRIITDHISNILFSPTDSATENLKKEGIVKGVFNVGDIMIDSLLNNIDIANSQSNVLSKLNIDSNKYLLMTLHRQENTENEQDMRQLLDALKGVDEKIIFPIHPRTKVFLRKHGLFKNIEGSNIQVIRPVGYLDFLKLLGNCRKILTDSGGVQKEAYILKKPCITMRNETEWIETIEDGWNILVGLNGGRVEDAINNFNPANQQRNVFGIGNSIEKMVNVINENC